MIYYTCSIIKYQINNYDLRIKMIFLNAYTISKNCVSLHGWKPNQISERIGLTFFSIAYIQIDKYKQTSLIINYKV